MQCAKCGLESPTSKLWCRCGCEVGAGTWLQSSRRRATAILWALVLGTVLVTGVLSPPSHSRSPSLGDVVSLLAILGAAPLASAAVLAALVHVVGRGRASYWLRHATLALMAATLGCVMLNPPTSSGQFDLGTIEEVFRTGSISIWLFIGLGVIAAVLPPIIRRRASRWRALPSAG